MYSSEAMKAKLQQVSQIINPFSGINFIISEFNKLGIPKLIDKHLGKRVKQATYKYSDVILTWIYSNICGAERLEDTIQLKEYFLNIPKLKFCSSDRIAGIFKSISSFNLQVLYRDPQRALKNEYHELNVNMPLNKLLIETALHTNLIKKNTEYTLDYDNYIVKTEKYDSKMTYKEVYGYNPGVAFIGKIPVFIEGRNGNTTAAAFMATTLKRIFNTLNQYDIKIKRFRSDAAAYQKEVVKLAEENNMEFFTRSQETYAMKLELKKIKWKKLEKDGYIYDIGSFQFNAFKGSKQYRIVVTKNRSFEKKHIPGTIPINPVYRFLITNNYTMTNEEVFHFYNARGSMERNFDTLGNDFNWKRVPFSFMHQNTSFLIIGAITNILYEYIIRKFSSKLHFVSRKQRLKSFIFSFIAVAGHWISEAGLLHLKIFTTTRDYNNLWLEGCFDG